MPEIPILLKGLEGEPLGRLRPGAMAVVAEAEQSALAQNLTKHAALPMVLSKWLEQAGFKIAKEDLKEAVRSIERVRRGQTVNSIEVRVRGAQSDHEKNNLRHVPVSNSSEQSSRGAEPMADAHNSQVINFFEMERSYPDEHAHAWYQGLVGLDDQKERLLIELEMLFFPAQLETWSRKHHRGQVLRLIELQRNRVPLIILEGDVGTGKTALSETVGDALARRIGRKARVHLLKINTQVRGTGQVGEMSDLIAQAFTQAETRARALGGEPVLLLLDEADALASSRDNHQMHHEDKAGLNTLLQRLDNLRLTRLPIVALFITNRPEVLDSAIRRRAALALVFDRPNDEARAEIIRTSLPELKLNVQEIKELVHLTGDQAVKNKGVPFTASDITDRLLPAVLRRAYMQHRELKAEDLLQEAKRLEPTPRMGSTKQEEVK